MNIIETLKGVYWSLSSENAFVLPASSKSELAKAEASQCRHEFDSNKSKSDNCSPTWQFFRSPSISLFTNLLSAATQLATGLGVYMNTLTLAPTFNIGISSFPGYWQEESAADTFRKLSKMVQIHHPIAGNGKEEEQPFKMAGTRPFFLTRLSPKKVKQRIF